MRLHPSEQSARTYTPYPHHSITIGGCNVSPIRSENSRITREVIVDRRIFLGQNRCSPATHVPDPGSVVTRGRDELSAIGREVDGEDPTSVPFESIADIFRLYFPDLEHKINR